MKRVFVWIAAVIAALIGYRWACQTLEDKRDFR
ncbi:hypothetical protein HNR27_003489 [Ornithinibacillus bavariensis]